MEITTINGADARMGMFASGLAAMGSVVPAFAALAAVSVKPRTQYGDAGNGGAGALDAWGPPV
jgi:hypothetical protein